MYGKQGKNTKTISIRVKVSAKIRFYDFNIFIYVHYQPILFTNLNKLTIFYFDLIEGLIRFGLVQTEANDLLKMAVYFKIIPVRSVYMKEA